MAFSIISDRYLTGGQRDFDDSYTSVHVGFDRAKDDVVLPLIDNLDANFRFVIEYINDQYTLRTLSTSDVFIDSKKVEIFAPLRNNHVIHLGCLDGPFLLFEKRDAKSHNLDEGPSSLEIDDANQSSQSDRHYSESNILSGAAEFEQNKAVTRDASNIDDFLNAEPMPPDYSRNWDTPQPEAHQSHSFEAEYLSPHFSAFYPATIDPNKPSIVNVYIHLPSAFLWVKNDMKKYEALMGGDSMSASTESLFKLEGDTEFTISIDMPDCNLSVQQQSVSWKTTNLGPTFINSIFPFTLQSDFRKELLSGQITIFKDGIAHGQIPISIPIQSGSAQANEVSELRRFRKVFASYSRGDNEIMEFFRANSNKSEDKLLVDVHELRSGENWSKRLLDLIEEADIFQLFWSASSAQSKYCEMEWRHALNQASIKERFIQPVWWEHPMAPPPQDLGHLHFTKVKVPFVVRKKMSAVSRLKNLFSINT